MQVFLVEEGSQKRVILGGGFWGDRPKKSPGGHQTMPLSLVDNNQ